MHWLEKIQMPDDLPGLSLVISISTEKLKTEIEQVEMWVICFCSIMQSVHWGLLKFLYMGENLLGPISNIHHS